MRPKGGQSRRRFYVGASNKKKKYPLFWQSEFSNEVKITHYLHYCRMYCQYWLWNTELGVVGDTWDPIVGYDTFFLLTLLPETQNMQWAVSKFTPTWRSDLYFKYLALLQRADKGTVLLINVIVSRLVWKSALTLVPSSFTCVWRLRFSRDDCEDGRLLGTAAV